MFNSQVSFLYLNCLKTEKMRWVKHIQHGVDKFQRHRERTGATYDEAAKASSDYSKLNNISTETPSNHELSVVGDTSETDDTGASFWGIHQGRKQHRASHATGKRIHHMLEANTHKTRLQREKNLSKTYGDNMIRNGKLFDINEKVSESVLKGLTRSLDGLLLSTARMEYHRIYDTDPTEVFGQFLLLGANLSAIAADEQLVTYDGIRYLDPFIVRSAYGEDSYPVNLDKNTPLLQPAELSPFCFPDGLKMWLIPKSASKLVQKSIVETNTYQAITFTGADGFNTYGMAVTCVEKAFSNEIRDKVLPILIKKRRLRYLARKIVRCARDFILRKKIERSGIFSPSPEKSNSNIRKSLKKQPSQFGTHGNNRQNKTNLNSKCNTLSVRNRAREAYLEMKKDKEVDHILLVQKCYVFTDVRKNERVLLCAALKQLIDLERRENMTKTLKRDEATFEEKQILRRHELLKFIRGNLKLSENQKLSKLPSNSYDFISMSKYARTSDDNKFTCKLPINFVSPIEYPLPLPSLDEEYGLNLLLQRLENASILINLLQLISLEFSVLVFGREPIEVNCCVETLASLLKPYKWGCNIFPCIPDNMIDVVQAPFPIIAGITEKDLHKIPQNPTVEDAYMNGLTIVNIHDGKVAITVDKAATESCLFPRPYLMNALNSLMSRLKSDFQAKRFQDFVSDKIGFSPEHRVLLRSARFAIYNHMKSLAEHLHWRRDAFKKYGAIVQSQNVGHHGEKENFRFHPHLYMEQIKNESRFMQRFMNTQMFICYIDKLQEEELKIEKAKNGRLGKALANSLWSKWEDYAKRKQQKKSKVYVGGP